MSLSRPIVALIGAGALGIALVGVGASAQFTTSVSSSQKIQAGTLRMSVWSPQATNGCTASTSQCTSVTLPVVGPVGSTFVSPQDVVYVTNTGNIPAYFDAFQLSVATDGASASTYLRNQTNVCLMSTDPTGSWVEGNGPLTTAISLTPTVQENPVKVVPNQTVKYSAIFYAGKDTATPTGQIFVPYSAGPPIVLKHYESGGTATAGCGLVVSDGSHTRAAWDLSLIHI
jgi:hypothetical protein